VAQRYGVFREDEGRSERAIFVIDAAGVICYIDIHDIDDQPDNEELYTVLRQLNETSARQPAPGPAESAGVYVEDADEPLPQGDVILYCARWCKDCRKVRDWLTERGLAFVEVDIDHHQSARNRIRQLGGGRLITTVVDLFGEIVLDFDPAKMEAILTRRSGG
jgi:hypothetical protein